MTIKNAPLKARKLVAGFFAIVCFILIFAIPVDEHPHFFTALILSKGFAFASGWCAYKLVPEFYEETEEENF